MHGDAAHVLRAAWSPACVHGERLRLPVEFLSTLAVVQKLHEAAMHSRILTITAVVEVAVNNPPDCWVVEGAEVDHQPDVAFFGDDAVEERVDWVDIVGHVGRFLGVGLIVGKGGDGSCGGLKSVGKEIGRHCDLLVDRLSLDCCWYERRQCVVKCREQGHEKDARAFAFEQVN